MRVCSESELVAREIRRLRFARLFLPIGEHVVYGLMCKLNPRTCNQAKAPLTHG